MGDLKFNTLNKGCTMDNCLCKKAVIMIIMFLLYLPEFNASNNIAFSMNNSIGFINGATFTAKMVFNSNSICTDRAGKPMFKHGDFNGDGRDDILFIVSNSGIYNLTAITTSITSDTMERIATGSPTSSISNFGILIFAEVGDFNNDKKDEVLLVYTSTNSPHEIALTCTLNNGTWSILSGPYPITNTQTYGSMLFVRTGEFNGNDTTDAIFIYQDVLPGYQTALTYKPYDGNTSIDNHFLKIGGPYHLTNSKMGTIRFVNIGDFNGDSKDDINIIYANDTLPYNYWSLTYNPVGLSSNIENFGCLSYPYKLTNDSMGVVQFSDVGDFNNDGKEDLIYVYRNNSSQQDWVLCYNPTSNSNDTNFTKVGAAYHITSVWSYGTIRTMNVGDFNGDGNTEIAVTYRRDNETALKSMSYSVANGNFVLASTYWNHEIQDIDSVSVIDFNYSITVGSMVKYMSSISDRGFKPLPENRNSNSPGNFILGWWGSLGAVEDYPYSDARINTLGPIVSQFSNNDPSNSVFVGLDPEYCLAGAPKCPTDTTCIDTLIKRFKYSDNIDANYTPKFAKNIIVQAYQSKYQNIDTICPYIPSISDAQFTKAFCRIDTNTSFNSNIGGYYLGDDIHDVAIKKAPDYWNAQPNWNTALLDLNSYIHLHSNKLTFAGETFDGLMWAYDTIAFPAQNTSFCDVPVMYEYVYWANNPETNTEELQLNLVPKLEMLRRRTVSASQPGFLYCVQAHKDNYCSRRAPTPFESRYDLFNAIIHGAGGVASWSLNVTDSAITSNIININKEIRENYSGKLFQTLCYGRDTTFLVTSSKDSFNKDFGTKIGGQISDINYIARAENTNINGSKFLLTVNNSRESVSNTIYYLPANLAANSCYEYLNTGARQSRPLDSIIIKGTKYKTLTVSTYEKFEVKIFGFNVPLSSSPRINSQNQNVKYIPIKSELMPNYPNPFNPTTTINYTLGTNGLAKLSIYNMLGQQVITLVNEIQGIGNHSIRWDGVDNWGKKVSSGVYFYKLETEDLVNIKKMLLVK